VTAEKYSWDAHFARWKADMFRLHKLKYFKQAGCPLPAAGKRCMRLDYRNGCLCGQLQRVGLVDHFEMWKYFGGPTKVWTSEPYKETAKVEREIARLEPAFAVFGLKAEVFDWSPYGGDNFPTLIKVSPMHF